MARESEQQPSCNDFIDKPAPGRDLLALFPAVAGGSLLLAAVTVVWKGKYDAGAVTGLAITAVVAGLVYWIGRSAAYGTFYKISSEGLELRCGIFKTFIRYKRILEISRVASWSGMVRHGIGYQNLGNRFSDYVQIKLKGQSVFLTPSDPEKFVTLIREHMDRA